MCAQDAVSSAREENNELEADCVDNESDSESESNKCDGWDTQTQSSCQANCTMNDLILKDLFYHSAIIYLMPETQIPFQSSVQSLGTNPKEWTRPQTSWFSSDMST